MTIWVDADACPIMIKDVVCKAAVNRKISTCFVANQLIRLPPSPFLHAHVVTSGFDEADNYIVEQTQSGDVIITSDIPLADEAITKGGAVISPRGEILTHDNIKPRLNMRDFLDQMRASGEHTGGQKPMNASDKQQFANMLDKTLTKIARKK